MEFVFHWIKRRCNILLECFFPHLVAKSDLHNKCFIPAAQPSHPTYCKVLQCFRGIALPILGFLFFSASHLSWYIPVYIFHYPTFLYLQAKFARSWIASASFTSLIKVYFRFIPPKKHKPLPPSLQARIPSSLQGLYPTFPGYSSLYDDYVHQLTCVPSGMCTCHLGSSANGNSNQRPPPKPSRMILSSHRSEIDFFIIPVALMRVSPSSNLGALSTDALTKVPVLGVTMHFSGAFSVRWGNRESIKRLLSLAASKIKEKVIDTFVLFPEGLTWIPLEKRKPIKEFYKHLQIPKLPSIIERIEKKTFSEPFPSQFWKPQHSVLNLYFGAFHQFYSELTPVISQTDADCSSQQSSQPIPTVSLQNSFSTQKKMGQVDSRYSEHEWYDLSLTASDIPPQEVLHYRSPFTLWTHLNPKHFFIELRQICPEELKNDETFAAMWSKKSDFFDRLLWERQCVYEPIDPQASKPVIEEIEIIRQNPTWTEIVFFEPFCLFFWGIMCIVYYLIFFRLSLFTTLLWFVCDYIFIRLFMWRHWFTYSPASVIGSQHDKNLHCENHSLGQNQKVD